MKNFIQPGKVLTAIAGVGGVKSGTFQTAGSIFGIAATSAAEGQPYELSTGECYEMAKATGTAWAMGDALYWDPAAKNVTKTAGSLTKIGVAAQSAGSNSAIGVVRLNSNF